MVVQTFMDGSAWMMPVPLQAPAFACQPTVQHLEGLELQKKLDIDVASALRELQGQVCMVACQDAISSRSVQCAIERANADQKLKLVQEFHGNVCAMIESLHGNHVLSKAIEVLPRKETTFVLEELHGKAVWLAEHKFGCRVFQRLIEHHGLGSTMMQRLVAEISDLIVMMAHNNNGNYVIQCLLEHAPECREHIAHQLLHSDVRSMACHVHANGVIQKYLELCCGCQHYSAIVDKLLLGTRLLDDATGERILKILLDRKHLHFQKASQWLETQGLHALSEGLSLQKAFSSKYWSHAVQQGMKILSKCDAIDCAEKILQGLRGHVCDAIKSPYANFVVCEAMRGLPCVVLQLVAQELKTSVAEVGTHQFGYKALLSLIQNTTGKHAHGPIQSVFEEILHCSLDLSCNEFGNYVISELLRRGPAKYQKKIAAHLSSSRNYMQALVRNRFGHHVARELLHKRLDSWAAELLRNLYEEAKPAKARTALLA
jgi:hypothetical protein